MVDSFCVVCGANKIRLLVSEACPNGCEKVEVVETNEDRAEDLDGPFRSMSAFEQSAEEADHVNPAYPPFDIETDWVNTSLYSTLEIDPTMSNRMSSHWCLFGYGRGQMMPESGRSATQADTNVPRFGDAGLPQGWQAKVFGWRVSLSDHAFSPVIRRWAMSTTLRFYYNRREIFGCPLSDFFGLTNMEGNPWDWPNPEERGYLAEKSLRESVIMQESLSYSVEVQSGEKETEALRRYLSEVDYANVPLAQSGPSPRDQLARAQQLQHVATKLETITALVGGSVAEQLKSVVDILKPRNTFKLRVHLNCAMRRALV